MSDRFLAKELIESSVLMSRGDVNDHLGVFEHAGKIK
jgi:hypothetical protein